MRPIEYMSSKQIMSLMERNTSCRAQVRVLSIRRRHSILVPIVPVVEYWLEVKSHLSQGSLSGVGRFCFYLLFFCDSYLK
ncbi:hypothetical protein Misp06_00687 [Microbulbifer sp. NBRC 101763]